MTKGNDGTSFEPRHGVYRRIYSDGVLQGKRINSVDLGAEWFLLCRIQSVMDDYGIFEADTEELWQRACARRCGEVPLAQVEMWMGQLIDAGLVRIFVSEQDGCTYGVMLNAPPIPARRNGSRWGKYPLPHDLHFNDGRWTDSVQPGASECIRVHPSASECIQGTTEQKQKQKKKKKQNKQAHAAHAVTVADAELPLVLETDLFRRTFDEWLAHRRESKKPTTRRAVAMQLKRLADMGSERAVTAINHSIANGWTGIFEPEPAKVTKVANGKPAEPVAPVPSVDEMRKMGLVK